MTQADVSEAPERPHWIAPPGPPQYRPRDNAWELSRYADVTTALRHPGVAVSEMHTAIRTITERTGTAFPHLETQFRGFLLAVNSPWHAEARRFVRQAVRLLEPAFCPAAVGDTADVLLAGLKRDAEFDAMPCLCDRLPALALARALGVAESDVIEVTRRTNVLFQGQLRYLPLRVARDYEAQAEHLSRFVDRALRGTATLDAIRAIGREAGLADAEVGALLAFLALAATDTTGAFLGNVLRLLGDRPSVMTTLSEEPELLRTGWDELMRFGSPIRIFSPRVTRGPLEVGGCVIPEGSLLILALERAHFDATAYPDPGRLDLRRRGPPSLAFGGGAHACVGLHVAREQASVLIRRVVERYTIDRPATFPDWSDKGFMRRLRQLPITLRDRV